MLTKSNDSVEPNRQWLVDKDWPEMVRKAKEELFKKHVINYDQIKNTCKNAQSAN